MVKNLYNTKIYKDEIATKIFIPTLKLIQLNLQTNNFNPYYFTSINYKSKTNSNTVEEYHRKIKKLILCKLYKVNKSKKLIKIPNKIKFLFSYELNALNEYHSHILIERFNNLSPLEFYYFLHKEIKYDFLSNNQFKFDVKEYNELVHLPYILKNLSSIHIPIDFKNSDLKWI